MLWSFWRVDQVSMTIGWSDMDFVTFFPARAISGLFLANRPWPKIWHLLFLTLLQTYNKFLKRKWIYMEEHMGGNSDPRVNLLLRSFDTSWLSFADKVTTGRYNFESLIVKIILLESALVLSTPPIVKTQCFVHLSFSSIFQLINDISSHLQKLLRYFNGTAIVVFSIIPFAVAVFTINVVLCLEDIKILLSVMLALKHKNWLLHL